MDEKTHKRLFIGIPVDAICQQQIDTALKPLQGDDRIRWTTASNRHLTLAFLGATQHNDLQNLQQDFTEAYSGQHAFGFAIKQLMRFPDSRGYILAAVNTPSPELLELYQRTRSLLNRCHIIFEEREYRPHITLARLRQPYQLKMNFYQALNLTLHVDCVNLYESVATEQGRQYVVLAQAPLPTKN